MARNKKKREKSGSRYLAVTARDGETTQERRRRSAAAITPEFSIALDLKRKRVGREREREGESRNDRGIYDFALEVWRLGRFS